MASASLALCNHTDEWKRKEEVKLLLHETLRYRILIKIYTGFVLVSVLTINR